MVSPYYINDKLQGVRCSFLKFLGNIYNKFKSVIFSQHKNRTLQAFDSQNNGHLFSIFH